MKHLAKFNWYVLLACMLVFAVGGTLFGLAAIVLSSNIALFVACFALCAGLMVAAGECLRLMELC
jgi:hypothetical protein